MVPNKRWIRAGALLSLLTWGCQTLTPITPSDLPRAPETDGEVRITMTNGDQVVLEEARIREDRIVGETEDGERSIPLDEVESLEAKQLSEARVVLFGLAATVAAGLLILSIVDEPNPPDGG